MAAVARIMNLTDGELRLPPIFATPADQKKNKTRQITLGAKSDENLVKRMQPAADVNEFELKQFLANPGFVGLRKRRWLTVMGAMLEIELPE